MNRYSILSKNGTELASSMQIYEARRLAQSYANSLNQTVDLKGLEYSESYEPMTDISQISKGDCSRLFQKFGIIKKNFDDWRMVERAEGEINGLPTSRGTLVATDGIECIIEQSLGSTYFLGHFEFFVFDKAEQSVSNPFRKARVNKASLLSEELNKMLENI